MAQAVEAHWSGDLSGMVVTRYGHAAACKRIEVVEAAHPIPDLAGLLAAQRMLQLVSGLSHDDLVLCLMSGGGSSLLPLPLEGLTFEFIHALNRALLSSGASISEMNCVRRHLSDIQGGRLAAACHPARVLTLLMSDVPGDHPCDIASGPTVADPTTCADALAVLRRYRLKLPSEALEVLRSGRGESIKPGDPRLIRAETRIIATARKALEAAAHTARASGYAAHILGDAIEGEAREVGKVLAGIARHVAECNEPFNAPCVLLSGGETTVTVRGTGRGGRNVECLLAFAIAMNGHAQVHALMGDTDGVDGQEEIAGALVEPDSLDRARNKGMHPLEYLDDNNAHAFFQGLGDSVITGPTRTNVNDFRAILITGR
jgi:glycerate 2-kinase